MSDFEFEGEIVNHVPTEEDPAADFLAREQDELAGLEDDNLGLGTATTEEPNSYPTADFLAGEQDELAGLEDNNLGLETATTEEPNSFPTENFVNHNEVNSEHMNGHNEPFPASTPARSANREEPQKIKIWREEQRQMLEVKDSEEEKKKLELKEGAKKELDDWYALYKEQIEKSKLNNRNAEKEWIADRDAESPGQEWERIARLCDFNPKSSRSTKDTSRMRSIILQLKQSPMPPRKSS